MKGIITTKVTISVLCLLFVGCVTEHQKFIGTPEYQDWMHKALAHPSDNPSYQRFYSAYHGKTSGLHGYFVEALKQAESPEIDAEGGEALSFELETIIQHIGDAQFSEALSAENPRVISAVAMCFSDVASPAYPQTLELLTKASRIDFPLVKTERGDYEPVAPKTKAQ